MVAGISRAMTCSKRVLLIMLKAAGQNRGRQLGCLIETEREPSRNSDRSDKSGGSELIRRGEPIRFGWIRRSGTGAYKRGFGLSSPGSGGPNAARRQFVSRR